MQAPLQSARFGRASSCEYLPRQPATSEIDSCRIGAVELVRSQDIHRPFRAGNCFAVILGNRTDTIASASTTEQFYCLDLEPAFSCLAVILRNSFATRSSGRFVPGSAIATSFV
jgi:hypothetical protein